MSQVVIEFPSLQGQVGGVYAGKAGAAPAVARAIAEHYQPLSAVAPVPGTLAGGLVAIAEKIDNIAGAWIAAEKPSGSRDPYGLRRAAMGIVRIALENDLHIVPRDLADLAFAVYGEQGKAEPEGHPRAEIAAFIWERLEGLLLDEGLPFPLVEAALGAAAPSAAVAPRRRRRPPPPRRRPRPPPLAAAARRPAARRGPGARLRPARTRTVLQRRRRGLHAAGRARRQGRGRARRRARASPTRRASQTRPSTPSRRRSPRSASRSPTALDGGDVEAALLAAAALRAPVDRYFDDVLVMDKDPAVRGNRLAQLTQITSLLGSLGDFSRLPVQQG